MLFLNVFYGNQQNNWTSYTQKLVKLFLLENIIQMFCKKQVKNVVVDCSKTIKGYFNLKLKKKQNIKQQGFSIKNLLHLN